jgi:hypothetical protein
MKIAPTRILRVSRSRNTTRGPLLATKLLIAVLALLAMGASYRTESFLVVARDLELAREVGRGAESHRRALATKWLGRELPAWRDVCPIFVSEGAEWAASGETSYVFDRGQPVSWRMSLRGTRRQILDSVLPHEIAHTIFATHFRRPLPRCLEEGICVLMEHPSTQAPLQRTVLAGLRSGSPISVERLFATKDYPRDIQRFYSQGYSLAQFLIEQGGQQTLIKFITDGLDSNDWILATRRHYGYATLGELQAAWAEWALASSGG